MARASLKRSMLTLSILLGGALISVQRLHAEAVEQHELDKRTTETQKKTQPIFRTLPSMHVTPDDDRLLMSVTYSHIDRHSDLYNAAEGDSARVNESLRLEGFNVNPMLALMDKRFGAGISGELGEGLSRYQNFEDGIEERGQVKYNGMGLHLFMNPTPEAKSLYLTTSFSLRGLNVQQRAKQSNQEELDHDQNNRWNRLDYRAYRTHFGAAVTMKPVRSFAIIPWGSYSYTITPDLDEKLSNEKSELTQKERLSADADHFLARGPRLEYGVDLSLRISKFEIHFGNLIGSALAARNESHKELSIRDHSITVGIGFQTAAKRSD